MKHVSASQVKAFRRCRSRWYHEKIDGHVEPPSEAMKRGTRIHALLEAYLVDGTPLPDDADGRIARPALTRLPPAGSVPRDQVESRFETPAEVYGIPFVGIIDLLEPDIITDHKTTSDFKYTKTEEELRADPQAQAYAIATQKDGDDVVRFRHLYIRTSGAPQSRETIVDFSRDDLAHALTRLRATVASMVETSQVDDVADVGHNLEACGDYGGCPHRARCASLGRHTLGVISSLFSNRKDRPMDTNDPLAAMLAARNPAEAINPPDGTPEMQTPEPDPQGELEDLEPEKVTRKRRAMRLPDVFDDDGHAVLVSRASKPELIVFATANKILVEPPEGRSKPGIREYRAAVEAFVAFVEPEDAPEQVAETWTEPAPVIEPTIAGTGTGYVETPAPTAADVMAKLEAVDEFTREAARIVGATPKPKTNGDLLTVYLNCCPRGPVRYLEELLAPITREVEKESGAPHYLAIPYNNGPKRVAGVFAHQIRSGLVDVTGAIVADLRLPASEAAVEVLLQYADEVVRRF